MKQTDVFYFEDLLYLALNKMDWVMCICRCYLLVQLNQQLVWQWCSCINFTRPLLPSVCAYVNSIVGVRLCFNVRLMNVKLIDSLYEMQTHFENHGKTIH